MKTNRVALIQPPEPGHKMKRTFLPRYPLGCAAIAEYVRDVAEVYIIDAHNKDSAFVAEALDELRPDAIGISLTWVFTTYTALEAARLAKERDPNTLVVMGGRTATFLTDELLDSGVVDVVVRGEGELTAREVFQARTGDGILGASWRQGTRNIHNPDRPYMTDLKEKRWPAYDLVQSNHLAFAIETSRGCPQKCSFCSVGKFWGDQQRTIPAVQVLDLVEHLGQKYGATDFFFADDNFTFNPRHVEDICRETIARGLKPSYTTEADCEQLAGHPDLIPLMAQAGFSVVCLGFEANFKDSNGTVDKRDAMLKEATRLLRKNGISVVDFVVINRVHQIIEEIEASEARLRDLNADFLLFHFASPCPGTLQYEQCLQEDLLLTDDWSLFDGFHQVVKCEGTTDLSDTCRRLYRRHYLRSEWIKQHLDPTTVTRLPISKLYWTTLMQPEQGYGPETIDEWSEIFSGWGSLFNDLLNEKMPDLTLTVRIAMPGNAGDLCLEEGRIAGFTELLGDADLSLTLDNADLQHLYLIFDQDMTSMLILGGAIIAGSWADISRFILWSNVLQTAGDAGTLGLPVWRRPLCLKAFNKTAPGQSAQADRGADDYIIALKTTPADIVIGLKGQRLTRFEISADSRVDRQVQISQSAAKALLLGNTNTALEELTGTAVRDPAVESVLWFLRTWPSARRSPAGMTDNV